MKYNNENDKRTSRVSYFNQKNSINCKKTTRAFYDSRQKFTKILTDHNFSRANLVSLLPKCL